MILRYFLMVMFSLQFLACSVAPEPIRYGHDQCQYCKMIISDARFGAELVTLKGRIVKFDAIECMVPYMLENGEDKFAFRMVTIVDEPGTLIAANNAQYLISEAIQSPMGGNLSAHRERREVLHQSKHLWLSWSELKNDFKEK